MSENAKVFCSIVDRKGFVAGDVFDVRVGCNTRVSEYSQIPVRYY